MKTIHRVNRLGLGCLRVLWPVFDYVQRVRIYLSLFRLRDALRAAAAEVRAHGRITLKLKKKSIPITLRCGTSDFIVLRKILIEGEYRMPFAVDGGIIIDAGANIGLSALFFASQYPNARVFALEPDVENFELLRANTSCFPNVVPLNAAIWNRPARLALTNPGAEPWAFQFVEAADGPYQAHTVQEIMQMAGTGTVDILKLDIEGGERELFNDPAAEEWLPAVRILVAELHDRYLPGCTRSLVNLLARHRFQCHVRGESLFVFLEKDGQPAPWQPV